MFVGRIIGVTAMMGYLVFGRYGHDDRVPPRPATAHTWRRWLGALGRKPARR